MDRMDRNLQMKTKYQEGHKKGLEQGVEQGRKKEKLEIARKMRAMGLSVADTAEATKLSRQEIEALDS